MADKPKLQDFRQQRINANKHSQRGRGLLDMSMRRDGYSAPMIAAKDGEIFIGSHRLEVSADVFTPDVEPIIVESDGTRPVIVRRTDIETADDPKAVRLGLADNRIAQLSLDWDVSVLQGFDLPDLDLVGFNMGELADLGVVEKQSGDAPPATDRAAELLEKWQVKTGDLWQIGAHRLICGDCTDAAVVEQVMGGEKAAVCLTDPPYGLEEGKESGKNDYNEYRDTRENLIELAGKWLPIARETSKVVVFSPGVTNAWLYPEADWIMCWFYGGGQLRSSWGFNCWQPFLCYGKDPSLASGHGGRPDAVDMNTPANAGDLDHPCPKPEKLWEWFIGRLSFDATDIFYDPFSGSGTTLVACENLGRKCRAVEISPAYVAVALERMATAFPALEIKRIE